MLHEIGALFARNRMTLAQDCAGAGALAVLLLAGLYLPLLF